MEDGKSRWMSGLILIGKPLPRRRVIIGLTEA